MKRFFSITLGTFMAAVIAAAPSFACSVCFLNDPASPFTLGLQLAVLTLFIVLLSVLIPLAKFFLSVRRRSQSNFENFKPDGQGTMQTSLGMW